MSFFCCLFIFFVDCFRYILLLLCSCKIAMLTKLLLLSNKLSCYFLEKGQYSIGEAVYLGIWDAAKLKLSVISQNGKFTAELGPNELLFILDDYVTKLSHSLTTSNKRLSALKTAQGQSVGFDNLDRLTPLQLAKNTIKLMPSLCNYLEKTMEFTQVTLHSTSN